MTTTSANIQTAPMPFMVVGRGMWPYGSSVMPLSKMKRKVMPDTFIVYLESYQSHTFEPKVGDMVKNVNKGCKHYKSKGKVLKVEELPDGKGKTVTYQCTNSGKHWIHSEKLTKTLDQLAPV